MFRHSLPLVFGVCAPLLSACDRTPLNLLANEANAGEAVVFDAVRSEQSLYVSDIIWHHLYSVDFIGRPPNWAERTFGVSGDEAQLILDFAVEAKARMTELQRAESMELCANRSSIVTRTDAAQAHLKMLQNVEFFEKSLVLELFDLLGHDAAQTLVQTIHQSRLDNRTLGSASADPTVFHLVDDRTPAEFVADFCDASARVAADDQNLLP